MKYFMFIILLFLFQLTKEQWPKVENVKKSHFLPSLEVKIHAPDQFQPKVQAEIGKLEETRERNEKKWMQDLESAFNQELQSAGKEIAKVIKEALSVFDDPNLLKKSVEYAINPPLVVMTTNNMVPVNSNTSGQNVSVNRPNSPSFKEIAQFKMNKLQKDTMKILIEEDNQVEKMRGAKMSITIDDEPNSNNNNNTALKTNYNFKQNPDIKVVSRVRPIKINKNHINLIQNGPIDFSKFGIISPGYQSFLETGIKSSLTGGPGKYTKPISVVMKLPSEPDPKLKSEIGKMEKKREDFEAKLFKKAKEEFKLITALTKKELQINLNHELLPFFVVSKNGLQGIKDVITTTVPSQTPSNSLKFVQIDKEEIQKKFPHINVNDQVSLNKQVYSNLLKFLTSKDPNHSSEGVGVGINRNTGDNQSSTGRIRNLRSGNVTPDLLKQSINFDIEKCFELNKRFSLNRDCEAKQNDYNILKSHLYSSFLQLKGGDSDLINVKFAASDEPYPTIEKLVAQMMTRRDLAEKFERLKVLEYESHLQKAENEMVQDLLHENIFRIMSFYGPSIEGMKEHIH